ncbi:carbamoyltransferase [Chloroflexota bacterium]
MKILGLHITGDQSSACLFVDGEIKYGAAEERFNREKRCRKFPDNAINFCMEQAGLNDLEEVDAIAISWNPAIHMEMINMSGFTSWRRYDPEWLYIAPNNLTKYFQTSITKNSSAFQWDSSKNNKIYYVNHHLTHLSHAAFQSKFKECAALIVDEYGEFATTTLAHVNDTQIEILKQCWFPHSLGAFYAMFTEFLGFRANSDEWKVMGMAAYGDPDAYFKKIIGLVSWDPNNLEVTLDLKYFNHYNMKIGTYLTPRLESLLGLERRKPADSLDQEYFDLAAAVQKAFEEIVIEILNTLQGITKSNNIVLGGGSFMNSALNGKVLERTKFDDIFITYAAADNGGATGAALWVAHVEKGVKRNYDGYLPPTPYIGPDYSQQEIETILNACKIQYEKPDNFIQQTVDLLIEGKVVGWFQGALEYGERALGNRSILADPRRADMKDIINAAVKYREYFRPFAPSILQERASDYFDIPSHISVPYMEQVYMIKEDKRELIPAVTHHDGSGRLQTVNHTLNPLYHKLISEFEAKSGVPVLLNTSFNVKGEPIVCSPQDAIRTFYSCGLDALVIGECIIYK